MLLGYSVILCTQNKNMKIKDFIGAFENEVPIAYAEDFDNVGLLVGDKNKTITKVLITHDCIEAVIDEAIEKDCNLIFSFHPIVFKGLKKITGKDYVERTVIKAIQHNIAIYSMHTALDNHYQGINDMMCEQLGLTERKILLPKKETICKLNTYTPNEHLEKVRNALFKIGAGALGNYEKCSFVSSGSGSYQGNEASDPTIGNKGQFYEVQETQLQITFVSHLKGKVINTLRSIHPYEEVAYEISTLENINQKIGIGMVGKLSKPLSEKEALQLAKETFNAKGIRHSEFTGKQINKIAVLGGSGAFAIGAAKAAGADLFLTGDVKYHEFYQAENQLLIADIGHYESECYTKQLIHSIITKKISNFAPAYNLGNVLISSIDTNPIKYF